MAGHVPLWPRYRPRPRDKQPSIFSQGAIYTLSGDLLVRVTSHRETVEAGIARRLDLFTEGALIDAELGYPWLAQAVNDPKSEVVCTQDGAIVGIRGRGNSNSVCWVSHTHLPRKTLLGDFLARLDHLGRYCDSGFYRSAASLGYHLMQASYLDATPTRRQNAPTASLRDALRAGSIGGRVDTPALGETLDAAWEEDMRSAYPTAAASPLPVGTAAGMCVESGYGQTWYCQCEVTIHWPLMWSPILIRTELGNRQLTEPGTYTVWLWKEEADEARELGISISVIEGWQWKDCVAVLAPWSERMALLRETAPTSEIAALCKLAAVGAIGRHGMPASTFTLVTSDTASVDAQPYLRGHGSNPFTDWSIQEKADPKANTLNHWHSYIQMQVRLKLFRRILLHLAQGNRILATDYDCIRLERPPQLGLADPSWRVAALTNVRIRHPRWIESDQKTRTPGVATIDPYDGLTAGEVAQLRVASKRELTKREWLAGMRRHQSGTIIPDDDFWNKGKHKTFRSA